MSPSWALLLCILAQLPWSALLKRHHYRRYRPHNYPLTLTIRNHNVTDARFFRLMGVDNTADFYVAPGKTFTKTYEVNRKGWWTLIVEFPNNKFARSPKKIISRDSYPHWIMEVYYYPGQVGFSEWHKMRRRKYRHYKVID
ncbi:unnamed protein product [Bursaphelenchus okinawaensis]|uniref:Uncharacterized protein n=1 Tax=Bursaphelenchus okinawaensis TaxID=465554 RepID=A0A811L1F2_9BILA|nr:unnamed protein product [Bursaphelenchus okinawaensis]CAG9116955.1 unnamed protein product [Bursaphelenchus okinawaensis]